MSASEKRKKESCMLIYLRVVDPGQLKRCSTRKLKRSTPRGYGYDRQLADLISPVNCKSLALKFANSDRVLKQLRVPYLLSRVLGL